MLVREVAGRKGKTRNPYQNGYNNDITGYPLSNVVKGGECLDVSINAKGGECWIWFSLMSKEFSNDKGITKDTMAGQTQWKTKAVMTWHVWWYEIWWHGMDDDMRYDDMAWHGWWYGRYDGMEWDSGRCGMMLTLF